MADLARLTAQALELDPESRAHLVDSLLESLELSGSQGASQAWFDEVLRRRSDVSSGAVNLLAGDELLADLDSPVPVTAEELHVLEARMADLTANPSAEESWSDAQAWLESRRR